LKAAVANAAAAFLYLVDGFFGRKQLQECGGNDKINKI
jgi:hypothetical protein